MSGCFEPVPSPSEHGFLCPSPGSEPIVQKCRNELPRVRSLIIRVRLWDEPPEWAADVA